MESERLILRKFSVEDGKDLFDYLSVHSVVRYEPYDVFTEEASIQEAIKRSKQDSFWAVCLKSNNKLIGNLYFQQQEPADFGTWEIGYVFNPTYAGNGYATESSSALIEYAFEHLQARRIVAFCSPDNISSWKLLERLHMRREGHLRNNIFFKRDSRGNPIWWDTYEYAILKDEWVFK